ncbi:MAG: septal ring lytic transglycosylase RlpA family protein [Deltaproteobacteria bacterium]|nr:septal ring lytic transglycosylase RlpA family protein [Deltaproteobacteria bacterium]
MMVQNNIFLWKLAFLLIIALTGCAPSKKELPYAPFDREKIRLYREEGLASWYGEEYHGRRTANGEIYDMYAMTAAHRTLPFNLRVRVTNLENRKVAEFRINDRGPFIPGRIIDLSKSGARAIGILVTGTAKVSVEAIGFSVDESLLFKGTYAIQVGAFTEKENALRFQEELKKKHPHVNVVLWESNVKRFYRVRLGAFRSEAEARRYSETLRKDNLWGFVVRED